MRKYKLFDCIDTFGQLESRISLTALSTGGVVLAAVVSVHQVALAAVDEPGGDDPLPEPEPPPPPFPGPAPPIGWPPIPPSGPVGPGK
jgi:hypothetical protein